MAPALPLAPSHHSETFDAHEHTHPKQILARADFSTPMEYVVMGFRNQVGVVKDSQDMEQVSIDLRRSDLVNPYLLQATKTFESLSDNSSTMGDADPMYSLPDFDLPEEPESVEVIEIKSSEEDNVEVTQKRLERRCALLQRRLKILQTRAIGKRISEEVIQTFERCTRGARRDGCGRPIGLKAFMKRVETTAALQASAACRTESKPTYFHAGTSKEDASRSASLGIPSGTLTGLEDTAGALRSHLSMVNHQLDSDATESSSGAESNDEAVTYNNQHQQHMPIENRALWTWQRARASIATRWCWLVAQIQELEYKIRQHCDLHVQVRQVKGAVQFEGDPAVHDRTGIVGFEDSPESETCARVRPLKRETFKKRKLLQMHNLHIATRQAARPSDINCSCQHPIESCPVCTGRVEPTQPTPCMVGLSPGQRVALVDPGYHPVLSDSRDISPAVHMAAITSRPWFRARSAKAYRGAHHSSAASTRSSNHSQPMAQQSSSTATGPTQSTKRHYRRLKRGRPPLSRKVKDKERDEEASTTGHDRGRPRASTESRYRRNSYDIDNIVIPQSVAAAMRPQILPYKEIITPKWRVLDLPQVQLNNGVSKSNRISVESEEEDISEEMVFARHTRAERRERTRFTRGTRRANAAQQQQQNQHDYALPPSPMPTPQQPLQTQDECPTQREIVRPYTPRQFPLPDDAFSEMVSDMPDGYQLSSPDPMPGTSPIETSPPRTPPLDDRSSTMSPMSPTVFEGDDPDDIEWDPNAEKTERRKSTFR